MFIFALVGIVVFGVLGLCCSMLVSVWTRRDPRARAAVITAFFLPWAAMFAHQKATVAELTYLTDSGVDTSVGYKNVPVSRSYTLIARLPPDQSFVMGPAGDRDPLLDADELAVQGDRVFVRSAQGTGVIDRRADTWRRAEAPVTIPASAWLTPQAYNAAYGPQPGPLYPRLQLMTRVAPWLVIALFALWVGVLRRMVLRSASAQAGRQPS